jgi:hypothetical protein
MTTNPETLRSLRTNGFMPVECALKREDLDATVQAYRRFLELDPRVQKLTKFALDGEDFGQYTKISGTADKRHGIEKDNKDIFHYGASSRQQIETVFKSGAPADLQQFITMMDEVFWTSQKAKRDALSLIDPNLDKIFVHEYLRLRDTLRLAAYRSNDVLAERHFDRGALTCTVGESNPGLRIAPAPNIPFSQIDQNYIDHIDSKLTPSDYEEGFAKAFLGAGWKYVPKRYTGDCQSLPLGWHDVVPQDKPMEQTQALGSEFVRWAFILFSSPHTGITDFQVAPPIETKPYKYIHPTTEPSVRD